MWSRVLISKLSSSPFGCTVFRFVRPRVLIWNWKLWRASVLPLHGCRVLLLLGKTLYVPQFLGLLRPICGPLGLPLGSGLASLCEIPLHVLFLSLFQVLLMLQCSPAAFPGYSSLLWSLLLKISPYSELGGFFSLYKALFTHAFCIVCVFCFHGVVFF